MALKDGVHKAKPALLEPIMAVEIRIPEAYMGEVNRDLNGRRGRVLGMDTDGRHAGDQAHVPQAELFSYATELRSLARAAARSRRRWTTTRTCPSHIAEKVIEATARSSRPPAAIGAATEARWRLTPCMWRSSTALGTLAVGARAWPSWPRGEAAAGTACSPGTASPSVAWIPTTRGRHGAMAMRTARDRLGRS